MIIMIDNYDSFTYNLVQYLGEMGEKLKVFRNDEISIEQIKKLRPQKIIISPGPGRPENAGICNEVIKSFSGKVPILGVCLGHQCIGYSFGASIGSAVRLMHGKTSSIYHDSKTIFKGLKKPFIATRYHSLIIKKNLLPKCLEISAWTKEGEIMGVRHKKFNVEGVQFHPESILTEEGKTLLRNFIKS